MTTIATSSPNGWNVTLTTASAEVLPANPRRKRVLFFNPNATAMVAVCPVANGSDAQTLPAAVNGGGSFTILPLATLDLSKSMAGERLESAFNGVSDTGGAKLTIWEFM